MPVIIFAHFGIGRFVTNLWKWSESDLSLRRISAAADVFARLQGRIVPLPGKEIRLNQLRRKVCYERSVYLEFYGLKEAPFNITPNPRFLFFSPNHREAFNHLLYGIRERKGFVQITGEVGAGKTTLCRAMLEQLGNNFSTSLILNPVLDADQLVKAV